MSELSRTIQAGTAQIADAYSGLARLRAVGVERKRRAMADVSGSFAELGRTIKEYGSWRDAKKAEDEIVAVQNAYALGMQDGGPEKALVSLGANMPTTREAAILQARLTGELSAKAYTRERDAVTDARETARAAATAQFRATTLEIAKSQEARLGAAKLPSGEDQPIEDWLADRLGIPRGTTYRAAGALPTPEKPQKTLADLEAEAAARARGEAAGKPVKPEADVRGYAESLGVPYFPGMTFDDVRDEWGRRNPQVGKFDDPTQARILQIRAEVQNLRKFIADNTSWGRPQLKMENAIAQANQRIEDLLREYALVAPKLSERGTGGPAPANEPTQSELDEMDAAGMRWDAATRTVVPK